MQWVSKCLATFIVFLNWVSVPLKAGNTASFCFKIPILVDAFVYLLIFVYFSPYEILDLYKCVPGKPWKGIDARFAIRQLH